jgi:hypothetical protein
MISMNNEQASGLSFSTDKKKSIGNNLKKKRMLAIKIRKKSSLGMQPPATPA